MNRRLWIATSLALLGCDPGVFRPGHAGSDAGSPMDAGAPRASNDAGAGRGGSSESAGASAGSSGGAGVAGRAGSEDAGAAGSAGQASSPPGCQHVGDISAVKIVATDLGALPAPKSLHWRSGGPAERIQDQLAWLFYETDPGPSAASWSSWQGALSMPPQLNDAAPVQPLFPSSLGAASEFRPTGAWVDGTSLRFFFSHFFGVYANEVGLARLDLGARLATIEQAPGDLFASEPAADGGSGSSWIPYSLSGAFLRDDYLYAYVCQPKPDAADEQQGGAHQQPCRAARVPSANVAAGASYTFWDGSGWSPDFSQAIVVLDHVPSGLSVSYDAYLDEYLAAHSGNENDVMLRWADAPEGPFHELGSVATLSGTAGFGLSYAALEHVTFRESCDRVLYVSYVLPLSTSDPNVMDEETHVLRLELKE